MRTVYDNLVLAGFVSQFNTSSAVVGSVIGAGTVTVGATVDTKGYNSAALRVFTSNVQTGIAVGAGSSLTAVLQKSTDGTTWSTAVDNTGAAISITQEATTTAVIGSARIEGLLLNQPRYLRIQCTANFAATTASRAFTSCAVLELGRAYQNPVSTTASNT